MVVFAFSGPFCSGRKTIAEYLVTKQKFHVILHRNDYDILMPNISHSSSPTKDWQSLIDAQINLDIVVNGDEYIVIDKDWQKCDQSKPNVKIKLKKDQEMNDYPELNKKPLQFYSSKISLTEAMKNIGTDLIIFRKSTDMVAFITCRWFLDICIVNSNDTFTSNLPWKRPFLYLIYVDAPILVRYKRFLANLKNESEGLTLEQFVKINDESSYGEIAMRIRSIAKLCIINGCDDKEKFNLELEKLDLTSRSRFRPNWDVYFMKIADLAASRSSCMKRQVGCVLVCDFHVVSTGYNGTPIGLPNCDVGGCHRCNTSSKAGFCLETCLCLHAEENTLLDAGKTGIYGHSILYCNTCPCLTCSVKICQARIKEGKFEQ